MLASLPVQIPFSLLDPADRPFDVVGLGQNSVDLLAVLGAFPAQQHQASHRDVRAACPAGRSPRRWSAAPGSAGGRDTWADLATTSSGRFGLASLEQEGVDVSAAQTVAARTRFAIVLVDGRTGDRTVLWDRDPALALRPADVAGDVWTSARVLHVDCEDIAGRHRRREGGARRAAR